MRRTICALLLIALCAWPAAALAHTKLHGRSRQVVASAAVHQHQLSRAQARCVVVTLSTVNRAFAAVAFPAHLSRTCLRVAANGVIIEHRIRGRWRFVTVGSDIQCPVRGVPNRVAHDLDVCA